MDPLLIAAAARVVGFLQPVVTGAAEELGKRLGGGAVNTLTRLLHSLRARWTSDPEAAKVLQRFETDPVNNAQALEQTLADRMQTDPHLASMVDDAIREIGPTVVLTMTAGHVNLQTGPQIGSIRRGRVSVAQTLETGDEQRGPVIGDIG